MSGVAAVMLAERKWCGKRLEFENVDSPDVSDPCDRVYSGPTTGHRMRLHSVYARFYRSLNYDFIRASGEKYEPDPWDTTPEGDYPFVRIKLRPASQPS